MRLPVNQPPQWKPKKTPGGDQRQTKTTINQEHYRGDSRRNQYSNKAQNNNQSPPSFFDDNHNNFTDDFGSTDEKFGRSFWMAFLEEEEERIQNEKSRRGTMVGHEIEQTWSHSSGSPLSISSELNQNQQLESPPDGFVSNKPTTTAPTTRRSTRNQRSFGDVTNSYQHSTPNTALDHTGTGPSPSYNKGEESSSLRHKETPSAATDHVQPDTIQTKLCGHKKLDRVGPNPVDSSRFRWAYDTWYSAGLMKQPFTPTDVGRAFWTDAHSCKVKNPSSYYEERDHHGVDNNNNNQGSAQKESQAITDDETTVGTTISSSPMIQKYQSTTSPFGPKYASGEDIERMSSTDSYEQRGFRRLLDMWRDQQDTDEQQKDKKNLRLSFPSEERDESEDNPYRNSTSPSSVNGHHGHQCKATSSLVHQRIVGLEKTDGFATCDKLETVIPCGNNDNNKSSSNANNSNVSQNSMMVKSESFASSEVVEHSYRHHGTEKNRALVILENNGNRTHDLIVGEAQECVGGQLVVVRKLDSLAENRHGDELGECNVECECSQSVFSGNDDFISFFLPQMGMACSCGRQRRGLIKPKDPTAIENVLRPWQCDFLQSFGIHRGEQLVKARHRSGDILAQALRQWRKKYDMVPFKTSSCGMAIHIWAKTCKTYVRSIRKQMQDGNEILERQPGALVDELSHFLRGLPEAPPKRVRGAAGRVALNIEPESQVEV
jgi:hypothetical protein